jgi:hypothetical protein
MPCCHAAACPDKTVAKTRLQGKVDTATKASRVRGRAIPLQSMWIFAVIAPLDTWRVACTIH